MAVNSGFSHWCFFRFFLKITRDECRYWYTFAVMVHHLLSSSRITMSKSFPETTQMPLLVMLIFGIVLIGFEALTLECVWILFQKTIPDLHMLF